MFLAAYVERTLLSSDPSIRFTVLKIITQLGTLSDLTDFYRRLKNKACSKRIVLDVMKAISTHEVFTTKVSQLGCNL